MHVTDIRCRPLYVVLNFQTVSGECLDVSSMYAYCIDMFLCFVYGVWYVAFGILIGMCQRPESRLHNYSM